MEVGALGEGQQGEKGGGDPEGVLGEGACLGFGLESLGR